MKLLRFLLCTILLISEISAISPALATPQEAIFLSNVAKQYMLAQFPKTSDDKKYVVKVSKIDPDKDYGGKCSGYLTAELIGNDIRKNNTVKITCSRKEKPYSIKVPVTVTVLRKATVAAENIPKGTLLSESLIEDVFINESENSAFTVTDRSMIIGTKSRKDIKAGEQIRVSDFCLVAKGDIVTIVAQSSNLSIKTQGLALEEGKLNDRIQVKNTKTNKIISAIVQGPGLVRVIF